MTAVENVNDQMIERIAIEVMRELIRLGNFNSSEIGERAAFIAADMVYCLRSNQGHAKLMSTDHATRIFFQQHLEAGSARRAKPAIEALRRIVEARDSGGDWEALKAAIQEGAEALEGYDNGTG